MDLFVFGGDEHGSHSHQMQVLDLQLRPAILHVGVYHEHALEETFLSHFVGGEHFDHPVHHLRPQRGRDLVAEEHVLALAALGGPAHEG